MDHRLNKFKVFRFEGMKRSLDTILYNEYLLQKEVLIVRVFENCRNGKLVVMPVDDVDDRSNVVNTFNTMIYKSKTFTIIIKSSSIPAIGVFQKYRKLRSRLFYTNCCLLSLITKNRNA